MTTVADVLTLEALRDRLSGDERAALDRILFEARYETSQEITRLEREVEDAQQETIEQETLTRAETLKREAAEAENERLRQQLAKLGGSTS